MSVPAYTGRYNQSARGGRGRATEQPRYNRPGNTQAMLQQHAIVTPRAQVPMNPSQQQQTVFIQAPYLFPHQQQQQATVAGVRAPTIYSQTVSPQLPPQIVRAQQPFSQPTLPSQVFTSFVPNPSQPINLQLQPTQGTPLSVQAQGVGATTGGLVTQQGTYNSPAQQNKPTVARTSRAIKIINPNTGTEVNVKEKSPEVPKPPSAVTAVPQPSPTFNNSVPRQQGLLPAPMGGPGPTPRPDIAKDFKQKVQFQMKSSTPAFVPGQPVSMTAPFQVSQTYHRPNAIIRDPKDKEKQQVAGPPKAQEPLLPNPTIPLQQQEPVTIKPTAQVVQEEPVTIKPATQVVQEEPVPVAPVVQVEPVTTKPVAQVVQEESLPLEPAAPVVQQEPVPAAPVVQEEPVPAAPVVQEEPLITAVPQPSHQPPITKPNEDIPVVDMLDPPTVTQPQPTVSETVTKSSVVLPSVLQPAVPQSTIVTSSTGPSSSIAPPVVNGVEGTTTEPVVAGPEGAEDQIQESRDENQSSTSVPIEESVPMKATKPEVQKEPIAEQPSGKEQLTFEDSVPSTNDHVPEEITNVPEATPSKLPSSGESKDESSIAPPVDMNTADDQVRRETKKMHQEPETVSVEKPAIPPAEVGSQGSTSADVELEKPSTQPVTAVVEEAKVDGPKKYARDFLLKFAHKESCREPPVGLVSVSDVFQRGGGQMLLNTSARPLPQMGYDNRDRKKSQRRSSEPKRIIHQPLQTEKVELHKAEQRWVRPTVDLTEMDEEEKETVELYRKFQGILNKLTPQKFQSLAEQALQLNICTEERLQGCIDKIFTKALEEPSFSIAYANLCKVLSPLKVEWEDEDGKPKATNFRRVLLTKCQLEFEKDKKDDEDLDKMTKGIEDAETPEEKKQLQLELTVFVTRARKRSLGNIRFIGELFKLQMLSETIMHECIVRLLKSTSDEESLECFARLITTTGKDLDQEKAKQRIDGYFNRISDIIKKGKIPARIKFMLQDIQELRRNQWIPRESQASTLKTIDQIHAEAKLAEEEDKRIVAQHQAAMSFTKGRGNLDERRRGTKDEWQTKGEKERPREKPKLDTRRLAGLAKGKMKDSVPILGPPSLGPQRPGGGWGRNVSSSPVPSQDIKDKDKKPSRSSSSGSKRGDKDRLPSGRNSGSGSKRSLPGSHAGELQAALQAVQKITGAKPPGRSLSLPTTDKKVTSQPDLLDEETVRRRTGTIVEELANNGDFKEALECIKEMKSPGKTNIFVSEAITHSLEKKTEIRLCAGRLLQEMVKADLLSEDKFTLGLNEVLEFAEDFEVDIPRIWEYFGEILAPLFIHSSLPLSLLAGVPSILVDSGKAAVLVASILVHCKSTLMSESGVLSLWESSKLDWTKLGVNSQHLAEFLQKQSLEYLLPSPPSRQPPPYFDEMAMLFSASDKTIDDIFDWVENTCSETTIKSPEFIQSLATAIVQATVSGSGSSAIFNEDRFQKRAVVLKKYVDEDKVLQVHVLYALQVAVTKLEHPPKLLNHMFNELYNVEVVVEDSFIEWRDRGTEEYGKGNSVQAVKTFFEWLECADVESDDTTGT